MKMKSPPHPGDLIREEVLTTLGLTIARAAEALGVRRATLSHLVHEKAALSPEMALRLEKAFGVNMEMLLQLQAGHDAAVARKTASHILVQRYRPNAEPASPLQCA